ncbi:MAG TPA: hypothetical protein VJ991_13815 [Balneolales bacterium]|nr:hypothetical protein [Balneolales bacterium]
MKLRYIYLFITIIFINYGCRQSQKDIEKEKKNEVSKAVKFSFSLERKLWENESSFKTRKQVYQHYRQGFSDELAESLTSYTWTDGGLRATEKTMEPPDTVHVLTVSDSEATVYYRIPTELRQIWQLKKYSIDRLRRDDGRWIIIESNEADTIPSPPILKP